MKIFKAIFMVFGIVAAVAVAIGAYWHIYTLWACALLVYTIKKEQNNY